MTSLTTSLYISNDLATSTVDGSRHDDAGHADDILNYVENDVGYDVIDGVANDVLHVIVNDSLHDGIVDVPIDIVNDVVCFTTRRQQRRFTTSFKLANTMLLATTLTT